MTSRIDSVSDLRALAGPWTLVPGRTSITFSAKGLWVFTVSGTFEVADGAGTVGDDGSVTGTLVVDATSLNTGNRPRDEHLRSADFFDVQAYPTITFAAKQVRPGDSGQMDIDGDLAVHGHTRPLNVPAQVVVVDGVATVTADIHLDRSDWGLRYTKKGSRLATRLMVEVAFVKS